MIGHGGKKKDWDEASAALWQSVAASASVAELSAIAASRRQVDEPDGPLTLQRTLSSGQLILLGIGAIVGAGIFVSTGTVAAVYAGPAIVISFVLAGLGCLCAGLCYAEFAAMLPASGSAYSYVFAAFGRVPAWLIGWCLLLEYLMAAANVAVGWSGYAQGFLSSLGLQLPMALSASPLAIDARGAVILSGAWINVPAVLILGGIALLLSRGVRLTVGVNTALVTLKLAILALFVTCGAFFIDPANWSPFLPPNLGHFGEFGWSGVVRGAGVIFYAYLGFDTVSTAARETRNPQLSLPIAIIGSLLICTVVYILFALVLTGIAPYRILHVANPISAALAHAGDRLLFLKVAVEIAALVGLTSVMLVLLYGQSRILYAMAQDGLVPSKLGRIAASSHAPQLAIVSGAAIAILAAGWLPMDVLAELISIGTLCAFIFVCIAVLVLRVRRPDLRRPFRVPAVWAIAPAGVAICGYLVAGLPAGTWMRFGAWTVLGLGFYAGYGRKRSSTAAVH